MLLSRALSLLGTSLHRTVHRIPESLGESHSPASHFFPELGDVLDASPTSYVVYINEIGVVCIQTVCLNLFCVISAFSYRAQHQIDCNFHQRQRLTNSISWAGKFGQA